ncbi:zinc finger ccch domain-containing protein 43 [Lasius niger]|uniref:Zinc finger ccch domain-containing protein 43 n=1 Tax=Lasius niger TaxID=67767 RepID=A0A0J7K9K1_LASNI|nr:zinc finger ccch domain-containing protein 43 [Lasius niger]
MPVVSRHGSNVDCSIPSPQSPVDPKISVDSTTPSSLFPASNHETTPIPTPEMPKRVNQEPRFQRIKKFPFWMKDFVVDGKGDQS